MHTLQTYYTLFCDVGRADCRQKQTMEFFDNLDSGRHGFLTVDQLLGPVMQMTGFDETGARQFIETLDFNEDGHIDKHEFMDMWTLIFTDTWNLFTDMWTLIFVACGICSWTCGCHIHGHVEFVHDHVDSHIHGMWNLFMDMWTLLFE